MSKKIILEDDFDDIDEQSLRERMDAAEEERQKRQDERQKRKKDRRKRVEQMIYQDKPIPLTEKEKFDIHTKKIFEELERREKNLEEKMKQMEETMTTENDKKNQELEDKIVNNFIKKLTMDNYIKLDEKIKNLTSSFNEKIEKVVLTKKNEESNDNQKIKSLVTKMQNKLHNMEEYIQEKEEINEEDELQYEQLQKQINDITLLLSKRDTEKNEISFNDFELKVNQLINENVDAIQKKLDKKIDEKLNQENRFHDIINRIQKIENITENKDDKQNIDNILENVIEQLKDNNDARMEKMYTELRKRINKIENIDDNNVKVKDDILNDMERRIYEIEVYKKRIDKQEERRKKKVEKDLERKNRKKKKFSEKKNKILQKHNLSIIEENSIHDEEIKKEPENKKYQMLPRLNQDDEEENKNNMNLNSYINLLNLIKKKQKKLLIVTSEKELESLYREFSNKYEKFRITPMKKMLLTKNELEKKQGASKAYGVKRGIIYLDDKKNIQTKVFKKYGCEIKERFIKECVIVLKYMHNFNFTFTDIEKNNRLVIYYDESVKPNMLIIEYKSKQETIVKKIRKVLNIGEELEIILNIYENKLGEHLELELCNHKLDLNHLLRIMKIQCNCYFEIEIKEFDDDILFDI